MSSWCTYYVTHCVTTHHTTSLLMSLRLDHQFDPTLTYPSTMHCPDNTAGITPGHNDWLTFFQHVERVVQANGFNNCPPSYSGQENRLRGKGFRDPHVFSANETQNTTDRCQKQDCLGEVATWKATHDVIGLVHTTPKYGISNDDVVDLPQPTASGRNLKYKLITPTCHTCQKLMTDRSVLDTW